MSNPFDDLFRWQKEMQKLTAPFQNSAITQLYSGFNGTFDANKNVMKLVGGLNFNDSLANSMNKNLGSITSFVNESNSFSNWQATFQSLASTYAFNLNDLIPDSLYDSLIDLTSEIERAPDYKSETSDLPAELTVVNPNETNNTISKNNITWQAFSIFIPLLFAYILSLQTDSAEQKRHEEKMAADQLRHEEIMAVEQKKIELREHSVEIQKQTATTQITKEQYQFLNEKIDLLIQESLDIVTGNPTDQVEDSSD